MKFSSQQVSPHSGPAMSNNCTIETLSVRFPSCKCLRIEDGGRGRVCVFKYVGGGGFTIPKMNFQGYTL